MKIEVGNYVIVSDSQCMWIEKKYISKAKSGKDKEQRKRVTGYFQNFDDLLKDFLKRKILASEAHSVTELLEEFVNIQNDIKDMIGGMIKSASLNKRHK